MAKTTMIKDLANKQLRIIRQFDAPLDWVWRAWTDPKLLDQWWAPKPWKAETRSMDFSVGGYWLYSMNGPDGEQHWARADYKHIVPLESFQAADSFCDEQGRIDRDIPGMHWDVRFNPIEAKTTVEVCATFSTIADLEKIVEMGFQEGFTAAHGNLDELLGQLVS